MKRYSSGEHEIVHGDVLEALASLEDGSVALIFADPPYNIGKDFDGLKDRIAEHDYLLWCQRWIQECERVLNPTGTFFLMNSTQNMPHLDLFCRSRFTILTRIVWCYDSSGVQARRYFGSM